MPRTTRTVSTSTALWIRQRAPKWRYRMHTSMCSARSPVGPGADSAGNFGIGIVGICPSSR
eukprot:1665880-Karenia_brevis.AAC.1